MNSESGYWLPGFFLLKNGGTCHERHKLTQKQVPSVCNMHLAGFEPVISDFGRLRVIHFATGATATLYLIVFGL